jgi:adenylosuccinate lyase
MRSFHEQKDFKSLLLADPDLMKVLTPAEVDKAFDLNDQMRNVDAIFERVFGAKTDIAPVEAVRVGTGNL